MRGRLTPGRDSDATQAGSGHTGTVLNQGDQGENLIPPSLILIPDVPDIPDIPDIGVPWVPSGA